MQDLIAAAKKWDEREFVVGASEDGSGGTTFRVNKLLPMEAFALLERLRAMFGRSIPLVVGSLPPNSEPEVLIAALLLSLAPADMEQVRRTLFAGVEFRNHLAKTWRVLDPDGEGMAFERLGPFKVYEVLARAFAVNFTEFMPAGSSLLDSLAGLTAQSTPPTSQPSSPEE